MFDRIIRPSLFACLLCVFLSLVSGCGKTSGGGPMGGAAAAPPPEVIVDVVGTDDVQLYVYTDGRTVPSNLVEIRARVSGYLEKLSFTPGAIVKQGAPLALIEQATYKVALDVAKAELASSKAQAVLAESNLERSKTLLESKTITTQQYQTDLANYDVTLAAIDRANANVRNAELNLQYTDMRSPITGKTTKNLVDIGNYVSPSGSSSVLLTIAQMDPMFVEFKLNDRQFSDLKDRIGFREVFDKTMSASEKDSVADSTPAADTELPLALTGIPVDVSLSTGVNILSFDFDVPGKIVASVDNQIDYATGQITLRAEVENPLLTTDGAEDYMIYPNQIARVRIPYEKVQDAVLVREEAILTDLDTKYVLVVAKGMYEPKDAFGAPIMENGTPKPAYETDIVERRDIKVGRLLDSQMRIVQSGLKPGESYIVQGVQRVRVGMEVKPTTLEEYTARRTAGTAEPSTPDKQSTEEKKE